MSVLSVFNDSILRGVRSYFPANRDSSSEESTIPRTHGEWVERYNYREAAYLGHAYTVEDIRSQRLFRAVDPTGKTISLARRLTRDVQHVVDTDAQALASRGLRLVSKGGEGENSAEVEQGRRIWDRSSVSLQAGKWARVTCALGDIWWEAVRLESSPPYDVRIVGYDPRYVEPTYDEATQTEIVRAVITIPFIGQDEDGNNIDRLYVRTLTKEEVIVTVDGVRDDAQSGPHGLGVTPIVHREAVPWTDPAHGLWSAEGLDNALGLVDSLLTQMLTIGNRYASPIWVATGFRLKAGADLGLGRVLPIPEGASFQAVEPSLTGVATLLSAAEATRALARETLPEFLFTDTGASASGSALNFRATAFVSKMEEMRGRWYDGLVTITEYARALEDNRAYDPEVDVLGVDAPPVLPVNAVEQVRLLGEVMDKGGLKRSDYIRHLQRLDIVPADVEPKAYAAEIAAEQEEIANLEAKALADIVASLPAGALNTPGEDETGEVAPGTPPPPEGGVTGLLEALVDTGMDEDEAAALIASNPTEEQLEAMVADGEISAEAAALLQVPEDPAEEEDEDEAEA